MSAVRVGGSEVREHVGIPRIFFNCMRGEPLESSKRSDRSDLYFKRKIMKRKKMEKIKIQIKFKDLL